MIFLLIMLAFIIVIIVAKGIRVVRPYQKGLIERLGKYQRTVDSGLTVLNPFLDRMVYVDMREQVVEVPPQDVITKDNVAVAVDAIIYYEVTDPIKVVYNVANFYMAVTQLAQTNLRNLIGEMALDESLTSRETINTKLRLILDTATDKWGTRVTRVELKRIEPPADVTQAMHRQMKAEREKRANILEAEGIKLSQILKAEGEAGAIRAVAEANQFKLLTVAEGEGQAIERVYKAIHNGNPTKELIAIKYLEALEVIANGQATKIFMPLETSGVLGSVAGVKEIFSGK